MNKTRINDIQAATLALVKARLACINPETPKTQLATIKKKYGEGTLRTLPAFATAETGGLGVMTQLIAPIWDEEHGGVYIPLLNIILQPKNLLDEKGGRYHEWEKAMSLAEKAGGRLFTRDEAYVLLWQKEAINAILEAHGGDPLASFFWSSSEYNEAYAWYVHFSSGIVSNGSKYGSTVARAVVAL